MLPLARSLGQHLTQRIHEPLAHGVIQAGPVDGGHQPARSGARLVCDQFVPHVGETGKDLLAAAVVADGTQARRGHSGLASSSGSGRPNSCDRRAISASIMSTVTASTLT